MVGGDRVKIIDILYRETPALLSTSSRESSVRRDLVGLRSLLETILGRSVLGDEAARQFVRDLGARPSLLDIRATFERSLSLSRTANSDAVDDEDGNVLEATLVNSVVYFYQDRLLAAFPGVRGLNEYGGVKEIVGRLDILFKRPLKIQEPRVDGRVLRWQFPLWWWRGMTNLQIESYRRLSETDVLINNDELRIRRAAVHNPAAYYHSFVYLEFDPIEPTGLYQHEQESIDAWVKEHGPYSEGYALFEDRLIRYEEFDDGAAVIDGRVVSTSGKAQPRNRYLTPYNIVVAGQMSPINNNGFDKLLGQIMNGILAGTHSIKDLADAVCGLPRRDGRDG
jgi:hypothetical protein